jgi:hypothetical protein
MEDKEGYNYVVFDANDVVIEKKELYKNGGLTMKKPKAKLLAPNGKPSNLTPEQYRLVRTPEFKAWFGDWENSPETASKVVDENGEPLVVYHGSRVEFNIFNGRASWKANYKEEIGTSYFTPDKDMASGYGGNSYVYAVFLNFKKLLRVAERKWDLCS